MEYFERQEYQLRGSLHTFGLVHQLATDTSPEEFLELHNVEPLFQDDSDAEDSESSVEAPDDPENDPHPVTIIFNTWTQNNQIVLIINIIAYN